MRKGSAQGRLLQGNGTISIMHSHFKPRHLTTPVGLEERTASRYNPFALIFLPLRRSNVSSTATSIGHDFGRAFIKRPNKIRLDLIHSIEGLVPGDTLKS